MSVYDIVSISLMSAPAAKTFSPPQTMTADDVAALGGLAARGDQAALDLAVEGVHRGPVEADGADAVLDLEAHEVAHDGASRRCVALGVRVEPEHPLVPDVHAGQDHLDRHLEHGVDVGARASTRCSPMTTRVEPATPVLTQFMLRLSSLHVSCRCSRSASRLVLDLPLAEDPHDLDLALGAPHEELLLVDGERDVAVVVEVGLQAEVDEHVEDPAAQRVLVRRRGEVRQRRGIGHGSNLTTH